jgi:outer membrane protein OmpA-like peptidoglycan-associated protein
MKLSNRRISSVLAWLVAAPAIAHANGVSVQTFTPSAGSNFVLSETGAPEPLSSQDNPASYRRYFLGFNYNYLNAPLVELDSTQSTRTGTLVDSIQTFNVLAGVEWDGRFSLNADMPLNLVAMPAAANQFTAGDLRLFPKLYLSNTDSVFHVALIPEVRLNTGDPSLFSSEDGVSYGISLAVEKDFGPIVLGANFGYRYSPYATFEDIDYRNRLPMSLSLAIPTSREFAFNLEAASQVLVPFDRSLNPSELYGGINYHVTNEATFQAGASMGSFNASSSSDYRVLAGLRFSPVSSDPVPRPVVVEQARAPEPRVIERVIVQQAAPARVIYTDREISVRDEVLFIHNSDVLTASAKDLLKEVASVMKQNTRRYRKIRIEGHTNEIGTDGYNLNLSKRRAAAVRKYLVELGVPARKLAAEGYGKRRPKVTAKSGVSKDMRLVLNRRVEFKVVN